MAFASWDESTNGLYQLTDEDISELHKVILEMYKDLFQVCLKYDLKMIAGGGTSLGAVRHKGFIPWDDDMDLNMPREDYERLIEVFEDELGEKYDLLAPGYKKGSNCFLMRVMKKHTTLLNMIDENSPYPTGIYIDITPIDYAPDNIITLQVKATIADMLRFISYSTYWNQYKSTSLNTYMTKGKQKYYYYLRMTVGKIFSFKTAEEWFALFDKFIRGKKSNHITVAAGREKYRGARYATSVFFPPKLVPFENEKMYIVNDEDTYMTRLYGDYMKIPDKNKRERHLCLKLDFYKSREDLCEQS